MTMLVIKDGIGASPFNPFQNEGEQDLFANYSLATADIFLKAGLQPGDFFRYNEGIFQVAFNRSGSSTAKGNSMTVYWNDASRIATLTAGSTAALLVASGAAFDVSDGTPGTGLNGKFVEVKTGTGTGQVRRILDNTATTITVSKPQFSLPGSTAATAPEAFDTTPVTNDTIAVFGFDELKKTTAATDMVQGVALGVVADDQLGVFQVAGPALALIVGSTDAVTALGPIMPSGTAGVLKGFTTAGETAADARMACGIALSAYSGASGLRAVFLTGKNVIGACAPKIR